MSYGTYKGQNFLKFFSFFFLYQVELVNAHTQKQSDSEIWIRNGA
jgi:hypothetical protein